MPRFELKSAGGLLLAALLGVITVLCCLPALDGEFTFDEIAGISENRALYPGTPISAALSYRFSPDQARPVFFASLLADARLFGMSPRPFRVTNLAIHILCGLLVFLLLARAWRHVSRNGLSTAIPLAGTALFLLHPLQSESVIYIWGRSGTLSTLFGLGALLLALAAGDASHPIRRTLFWALALTSLSIALGAKEEAVVVPLIYLIWVTLAEDRAAGVALRGMAILSIPVALFLVARSIALGSLGRQVYSRSIFENILGQAGVMLRTAGLVIFPSGQSIDPPASVPPLPTGLALVFVCLVILAGALYIALPSGGRPTWKGRLPFRRLTGGILIATAGCFIYWIVPLPDLMSERRAYLPMFGAALALTGLLGILLTARSGTDFAASSSPAGAWVRRSLPYLPVFVLVLVLAPALYSRAHLWAEPRALWEEAARVDPERVRPWINLGVMAIDRGEPAIAGKYFDRAVSLEPRNPEVLFNRGKLQMDGGNLEGALRDLEVAVESGPAMKKSWINLGIVRTRLNDLAGAETALQQALSIDPGEPRALSNLAEILRATGRTSEALTLYRRALESDPTYAYAAARLGVALEAEGDFRGALAAYRECLDRGPATPADRDAVLKKVRLLEMKTGSGSPPGEAVPPSQ